MIDRIPRNWAILFSAGLTLLGSAAFGYLAGQFFWQGAFLATSILGVGLPLTSWDVLWLEPPDRDEELLLLIIQLIDLLDRYLQQVHHERLEGFA